MATLPNLGPPPLQEGPEGKAQFTPAWKMWLNQLQTYVKAVGSNSGGGGGSVTITQPTKGLTVTPSGTPSAAFTLALADALAQLQAISTPGYALFSVPGGWVVAPSIPATSLSGLVPIANAGFQVSVNKQTGTSYAYLATDINKLVTHANASAIAATIASAATAGFGSGFFLWIQNTGVGTLTITPTTSTIDGASTLALTTGQGCFLTSDGTNYFTERGVGGGAGSPLTTKGDLFTHSTVDARLPVGTDGLILVADSTQATGLKWGSTSNATGDALWDYRNLVLLFEGKNGATRLLDSSQRSWCLQTNGAAALANTTPAFVGTTYGVFNGTTSFIIIAGQNQDWALGAGDDFVIEGYVYLNANNVQQIFFEGGSTGGPSVGISATGKLQIAKANVAVVQTAATTVTTGAWHYFEFTRTAGTAKIFLDGVQDATGADTTVYSPTTTAVTVGGSSGGGTLKLNGNLQMLRSTVAHGGSTAGYTPPTSLYPVGRVSASG